MKLQRVDIRDGDVVGGKYVQTFYWTKERQTTERETRRGEEMIKSNTAWE